MKKIDASNLMRRAGVAVITGTLVFAQVPVAALAEGTAGAPGPTTASGQPP